MPGPSSSRRTCSRDTVLLISACDPPRRTIATLSAPELVSVCWKPLAIARKDSSTTTTRATATTVESDSQKRCGMLIRLMRVTAATCSKKGRMVLAPTQRGGDLEAHGSDSRDQPGGETEGKHQQDCGEGNARRDREARDEIADTGFESRREHGREGNSR